MKFKITRSFYIRIAALILVILLGVWMFFIGKQHTILLDNNKVGDVRALEEVSVSVDGGPAIELYSRMRDQAVVTGQSHTLNVVFTGDDGTEYTFEKKIKLPIDENMMILYLPVLVADPNAPMETWLAHFESQAVTVDTSEEANEVVTDDMSMMSEF